MWIFYHDVASASPMHEAGFELGIGALCLASAVGFWFLFTRWCANESR